MISWTDETGSYCALYVTNGGPIDEPMVPATLEDLRAAGYVPAAELRSTPVEAGVVMSVDSVEVFLDRFFSLQAAAAGIYVSVRHALRSMLEERDAALYAEARGAARTPPAELTAEVERLRAELKRAKSETAERWGVSRN